MPDTIEIRRLEVPTHIGVPDAERAQPQTLWVTVRMQSAFGLSGLQDRIEHTIDYYAVAQEIKKLAAEKPRCLVETLAEDIANFLLSRYNLKHVAISVEKKILPDTECVAVHIERGGVAQ